MKGEIIKVWSGSPNELDTTGELNPWGYEIKSDEDDKNYFAHMGDIMDNEKKLIELSKHNELSELKEGEKVEFEPLTRPGACHVKKI